MAAYDELAILKRLEQIEGQQQHLEKLEEQNRLIIETLAALTQGETLPVPNAATGSDNAPMRTSAADLSAPAPPPPPPTRTE